MTTPFPGDAYRYTWGENSKFHGDAQATGEALAAVRDANAGDLPHRAVVEAARPVDSVLHRHFPWDDAVAAELYRLDVARELIRSINVVSIVDDTPVTTHAYLNVVVREPGERPRHVYRDFNRVVADTDMVQSALNILQTNLEAVDRAIREVRRALEARGDDRLMTLIDAEMAITTARSLVESL